MKYLDNGFYQISRKKAKELAGVLPPFGKKVMVKLSGVDHWLTRTVHDGKQVWAVYQCLKQTGIPND